MRQLEDKDDDFSVGIVSMKESEEKQAQLTKKMAMEKSKRSRRGHGRSQSKHRDSKHKSRTSSRSSGSSRSGRSSRSSRSRSGRSRRSSRSGSGSGRSSRYNDKRREKREKREKEKQREENSGNNVGRAKKPSCPRYVYQYNGNHSGGNTIVPMQLKFNPEVMNDNISINTNNNKNNKNDSSINIIVESDDTSDSSSSSDSTSSSGDSSTGSNGRNDNNSNTVSNSSLMEVDDDGDNQRNQRTQDNEGNEENRELSRFRRRWKKRSYESKFLEIVHPWYVYHRTYDMNMANRKYHSMNDCNWKVCIETMDDLWKKRKKQEKKETNQCMLAQWFLVECGIIPNEKSVWSNYFIKSNDLINIIRREYEDEDEYENEWIDYYDSNVSRIISNFFDDCNNSSNEKEKDKEKEKTKSKEGEGEKTQENARKVDSEQMIFLYSFLKNGVGIVNNGLCSSELDVAKQAHDVMYAFLNEKAASMLQNNNFNIRDYGTQMEWRYKEFVFRHGYNELSSNRQASSMITPSSSSRSTSKSNSNSASSSTSNSTFASASNSTSNSASSSVSLSGKKHSKSKRRSRSRVVQLESNVAETCTLDISIKLGCVTCPDLYDIFDSCRCISSLRKLYKCVYPSKKLKLVNLGFFQSPQGNAGQNWHCDHKMVKINQQTSKLPQLITVLCALTPQRCNKKEMTTTGSTVFAMGTHHPIEQIRKRWRNKNKNNNNNGCNKSKNRVDDIVNIDRQSPYRVVQPILNIGDMVCFAGNLLHFGAANNFIYGENSGQNVENVENVENTQNGPRIVLYGVLHLLEENRDEEYLKSDSNIANLQQLSSIQMSRYLIAKPSMMEPDEPYVKLPSSGRGMIPNYGASYINGNNNNNNNNSNNNNNNSTQQLGGDKYRLIKYSKSLNRRFSRYRQSR